MVIYNVKKPSLFPWRTVMEHVWNTRPLDILTVALAAALLAMLPLLWAVERTPPDAGRPVVETIHSR